DPRLPPGDAPVDGQVLASHMGPDFPEPPLRRRRVSVLVQDPVARRVVDGDRVPPRPAGKLLVPDSDAEGVPHPDRTVRLVDEDIRASRPDRPEQDGEYG